MGLHWHEKVDGDQELQNPTSAEKMLAVGEHLRLVPGDRVLDVACGRAGPAVILAEAFGCRIHGIDVSPLFVADARERVSGAGLDHLVDIEVADAASVELGSYDVVLCLGATFIWGQMGDAARVLARVAPRIAIGEVFTQANGAEAEDSFVDLPSTVARFESAGIDLTGIVSSSQDDWDRYESLLWRGALEVGGDDVLAEHRRRRAHYFSQRRGVLGWAVFTGLRSGRAPAAG